MIAEQRHIIKRQVVEIGLSQTEPPNYWQDYISDWYKKTLLPIIDAQFSKLTHPGEVIRIDELEIDLGTIDPERPEETIHRLEEQLYETLYEKCLEAKESRGNGTAYFPDISSIQTGLSPGHGPGNGPSPEEDLILYFLQSGGLPWWHRGERPGSRQIFQTLEGNIPGYAPKIKRLLGQISVRRRLFYGLSATAGRQLLEQAFPASAPVINKLERFFREWYALPVVPRSGSGSGLSWKKEVQTCWKEQIAAILLEPASSATDEGPFKDVVIRTIKELISRRRLSVEVVVPQTIQMLQNGRYPASGLRKQLQKMIDPASREHRKAARRAPQEEQYEHTTEKSSVPHRPFLQSRWEEWPAAQAGLVLSWCYLQYFFQGLNLVEEGVFRSEEDQWKGVHLLYFLATGRSAEEEAELGFCKLLCGLIPEAFVPGSLPLSEQEREEADHLVQVMINNWKALKKISIPGFRKSFLQRSGILKQDFEGWRLQIERRPYDLLLEKISWPISVIKLPWNEQFIHVEW